MDRLRDNGLTIALLALFLLSLGGMIWSGWIAHNGELAAHGSIGVGLLSYLQSGDFFPLCSRTGRASSCRWPPM